MKTLKRLTPALIYTCGIIMVVSMLLAILIDTLIFGEIMGIIFTAAFLTLITLTLTY